MCHTSEFGMSQLAEACAKANPEDPSPLQRAWLELASNKHFSLVRTTTTVGTAVINWQFSHQSVQVAGRGRWRETDLVA